MKVAIAGIQETKWFGQDVRNADEYTLLHSGLTLPGDGEPLLRNQGWGIMVDQSATAAWKNVGECWEAVSSQIVTAWLQIVLHGHRRHSGSKWTSSRYLSWCMLQQLKLLQMLKQSLLMLFNVL